MMRPFERLGERGPDSEGARTADIAKKTSIAKKMSDTAPAGKERLMFIMLAWLVARTIRFARSQHSRIDSRHTVAQMERRQLRDIGLAYASAQRPHLHFANAARSGRKEKPAALLRHEA